MRNHVVRVGMIHFHHMQLGVRASNRIVVLVAGILLPCTVEAHRQFAFGVVLAKQHLRNGVAAFLSGIPGVQQCRHLVQPQRGVHRAARSQRHYRVRIGRGHGLNQRVLSPGQGEGAVRSFALGRSIEAHGDNRHIRGGRKFLHVLANQLVLIKHGNAETVALEARQIIGNNAHLLPGGQHNRGPLWMLALDLLLLDFLFAVHAHRVVVAAVGRGQHQILACLACLERCRVTNAARSLVRRAPPLVFVVAHKRHIRFHRRSGKVLAGIGGFLNLSIPLRPPEKLAHIGQSARIEHMHLRPKQIRHTGHNAAGLEGICLRRSAAAGHRRVRIRSNNRNRLDLRCIQRQNLALVLQQRQALQRAFKRHLPRGHRVGRFLQVQLRPAQPVVAQRHAQNAQHFVVNRRFLHSAALHRRKQHRRIHKLGRRHFEIQPVIGRGHAVVGRIPVRHQHALEFPIALQHFQIQVFVLRGVRAVDQVVGVHHRVHVALLHRGFKRREIHLPHRPLVGCHVHVVPVVLLVVQGVVLHRRAHALRLHALDVRHHDR